MSDPSLSWRYHALRHIGAFVVAGIGCLGVLALVLAMNEPPPKRVNAARGEAIALDVAPPKPKPKPKPREDKPKKAQRAQSNRAPVPQLVGSISAADLGIPGLGDVGMGSALDDLLGDAAGSGDLVMPEGAVDSKPKPLAGNPSPSYPARAAREGVTGAVVVSILIGPDGQVLRAKIKSASPPGVFEEAALDAVRRWRFEPALYNGQPIKIWTSQKVFFG